MSPNKQCNLIFKEKEALPLEREFMNEESKSTYALPLTENYSSLCYQLSSSQKQILAKEVNKARKIQEMSNQMQSFTQNLEGTQQFFQQTMKIKPKKLPSDYIPQCLYGSDSLVDSASDFNFDYSMGINVLPRQQTPKSSLAILLYSGEEYALLNDTARYFQDMNIYTIILINGKTDFLKLMQSQPNQFEKVYKEQYLKFENFYQTSSSHAMIFEFENLRSYIVFPRQLQYIQLIKWIYLGIGTYVDPQFLIVVGSNQQFKITQHEFKQLLTYCGDKKNKTFGLQWIEKTRANAKLQGLKQLINFIDYGAIPISVDGLFTIKQFHNPLSCIYNWDFISLHVINYFTELYEKSLVNDVGLSINSILPVMMYNTEKMELCQLAESISEQNIGHYEQLDVFQKIGHKNYSIQQQLQEGVVISNSAATVGFRCTLLFQYLISILFYLEKYFSFSICLFFAFQCPYQLLYYLLDHQKGYTALSVILPTLYILNVLMFLIISFLYKMEDKIVLKQLPPEKVVLSLQIDKANVKSHFSVENRYQCYSVYDQRDNELKIDVVNDNLIQKFSKKIQQNEGQAYCKIDMRIPQYLNIVIIYQLLKTNQSILDFIVVFATITNLIVIYGQNFIWEITIYQLVIIIIGIVGIGLLLMISCLRGRSCNPYNLFQILINFSTINFLSTFYCQTLKVATPEIQIKKKRQLALQLFFNFIALYIYIAIESYYNYAGYVLLAIVGYLVFMQLFPYLLLIIKCGCDPKYSNLNEAVIYNFGGQSDDSLILDKSIDQTLQDSRTIISNMQQVDQLHTTGFINGQTNKIQNQDQVNGQINQQSNNQSQKTQNQPGSQNVNQTTGQINQKSNNQVLRTQNQQEQQPTNQQSQEKQQIDNQYRYSVVTNQHRDQNEQFQQSNNRIPRANQSHMPQQIQNSQFNAQPYQSEQNQFKQNLLESSHINTKSSKK